jgi:putative nucleotidyltransferase with HDIG domain
MGQELKDILDGSSPLMENFKDKTPGTYRHCQNVAALCESISSELSLDAETLVAAAKLHDIGKSNNPIWFSENQPDSTNPHDDAEPLVSYQYISRHISDSCLKLVQIPEIPRDVITCVSEHHGDTVIKSIYLAAKKIYNGSTNEDQYRYKNRKPSTIESAVLMMSDVVESACRAMDQKDKLKDHKKVINTLIDKLIADEQLDILTIGHVRIIKKILYKEIDSIYHKRVDYPEEEEEVTTNE